MSEKETYWIDKATGKEYKEGQFYCHTCEKVTKGLDLGDPCECGSDNCSKCLTCGDENHD